MSEYVSEIKTTDGWKKLKDSDGRELIAGNTRLIRQLQNTPLPAYRPEDLIRTDRVYLFLDDTYPDYRYGYIYYFEPSTEEWTEGWQYQSFELGSYGGNPLFISLPSTGVIVSEETVTLDLTVYTMRRRRVVNFETSRVAEGGAIKYIWINDSNEVVETESMSPPDSNYALILYHSRNSVVPATPCNIVIDDITYNQAPVKENNMLWINANSTGFLLTRDEQENINVTINLTCVAFQRRINIDTTVTVEKDIFTYLFINADGNIITSDSIKTPANYALLAYVLNMRLVPASPCDVTYAYENNVKYPATSISAGLSTFAHANPVTGINDRNYIDLGAGVLYIDYLRIWTTNQILVVLQDVTFNFTVNSSYHVIFYDTFTNNIVEGMTSNQNSERFLWLCTVIPNNNYYVTQYPNIRMISNQNGYYSCSQRIGLFGDSIMTGTAATNISVNLKTVMGIEGYNGAVGGSGFLKGWCISDGGIDEVQEATASRHSTGQFNMKQGIDVDYPAGTSFDIGTMIDTYLQNMLDLKISHIYIHNGNNDILSGSQNIADFWDNFNPQTDYDYTHNVLANRIIEVILKLKQYNIDTTLMLPIGRQFTDNSGNYRNHSVYNARRAMYIKIVEKLAEEYELDLLRTDKLFSAIVPKDSGLTLRPMSTTINKFLSSDNLHPTAWGYNKMACAIANHYYNFNKIHNFLFY